MRRPHRSGAHLHHGSLCNQPSNAHSIRRGATTKVTNAIFGRSIPAPYRQVPRTAVFGTLENVRMRSAHIHRNSKATMKYVCDAYGGKTWFRIETEAEATAEADVMRHNVAKYFGQEK